ncbi:hypothetical protein KX729_29535 [Rhizobium sp. XQZ8]|uniref:hypothetical protein n=1 Tax=Rhizobium populisoli TaxID=2859785 RepID=UPI001CA58AFA|nr:hypothetical protein [Rhizobium populisoli]MBW6425553.1 hypothetical protein [Rhizobium populisoli]
MARTIRHLLVNCFPLRFSPTAIHQEDNDASVCEQHERQGSAGVAGTPHDVVFEPSSPVFVGHFQEGLRHEFAADIDQDIEFARGA